MRTMCLCIHFLFILEKQKQIGEKIITRRCILYCMQMHLYSASDNAM